ncbi:MAG: SHOCT domain-containing protein [Actinomycetota bacterium]|nr:SHOCT domain-containing protein [Actinomycetota bacterium]
MMWHTSFWPVLVVIPVVIALVVTVARRLAPGHGAMGMGCGFGPSHPIAERTTEPPAREDPLAIVRERYARGEIDHVELDQRIEGLLRSEPTELARSKER